MPLLFYLPIIIWMGLFEVAQDEMRVPVKVKALRETHDDRKRKRLEPPQGTRHSNWSACRRLYGADLRKGNHLVYREHEMGSSPAWCAGHSVPGG